MPPKKYRSKKNRSQGKKGGQAMGAALTGAAIGAAAGVAAVALSDKKNRDKVLDRLSKLRDKTAGIAGDVRKRVAPAVSNTKEMAGKVTGKKTRPKSKRK